jgi:DNA-binding transcriptional regulator YiaG
MTPHELKAWRESLNMTQREFADFLKPRRTDQMVSKWERGASPIPEWMETFKEMKVRK